jgi:hypothetical protein
MTSVIEDIHDGLDHSIRVFRLLNTALDCRCQWKSDRKRQVSRFKDVLSSDAQVNCGLFFDENGLMMRKSRNRAKEAATLLMNELKNSSDFYDINGLEVVQGALNRLIRICGLQAPSLPEWFVPRNDVEILDDHTEDEHFALSASAGKTFDGRYKNMNVILTKIGVNQLKSFASRWYPLRHPRVLGLYGTCHIAEASMGLLVLQCFRDAATLLEVVSISRYRSFMWQKLYEVALGLQYLHERNVIHGDIGRNTFVIGADMNAKIMGFERPRIEPGWCA